MLVQVNSTAIQQLEYHKKSKELDVLFTDGSMAVYKKVPLFVFEEMIKAKSIGTFFNIHIRNKYPFS